MSNETRCKTRVYGDTENRSRFHMAWGPASRFSWWIAINSSWLS